MPRVKSRELSVCSCQEIGFDISIPSSYIICRSRAATVGAQDLMKMPHKRSAESRENPEVDEILAHFNQQVLLKLARKIRL